MPDWYVHLPSAVHPVAFSIGFFDVRWYALMYLVGLLCVWILLLWLSRKKEASFSRDTLWDVMAVVFLGGILGGRMGFAVLYGDGVSFWEIFSPWDAQSGEWTGWYGMSFFGAVLGAMISGWVATRWKKVSFLGVADCIAPLVPIGIFFGRIGNFFNGELIGRETNFFLGMMVNGAIRHPSQLYEAIAEGVLLFLFLWFVRRWATLPGGMLALLGMGYGSARFVCEFFREESLYAWGMTQGQFYSIILLIVSALFLWRQWRKYGRIV